MLSQHSFARKKIDFCENLSKEGFRIVELLEKMRTLGLETLGVCYFM